MENRDTQTSTFFNVPVGQFPDRSLRWLLADPTNVQGLFEIIAEDLAESIDFGNLTPMSRSLLPDALREQEADIIYTVPFRTGDTHEELLIFILIEHQSTVDPVMGFRMLFYMTHLWDAQRRDWDSRNVPKSEWRFRPIVPIVLYTGERDWQHPITLDAMMDLPAVLSEFVPRFNTLFLNVKGSDASELTRTGHIFGWLLRVLQTEGGTIGEVRSALVEALSYIDALGADEANQWKRAINYLYLLIRHRRPPEEQDELKTLVQGHTQDRLRKEEIEEMAQSMAEHLFEQGKELGVIQAKRDAVLRLLQGRFDALPEAIISRVSAIEGVSGLDTLFDEALTAESLDDINWQNGTD